MPSDQIEFLTIEEAAELLRIGRTSAYALAREWRETGGRSGLPVVKLGKQLRVPRAVLADLHADQAVAPQPQTGPYESSEMLRHEQNRTPAD